MSADPSTTGTLKISGYCSCGSTFHGSSAPPAAIEATYTRWRAIHDRDGHHAVDQREAAAVRRKDERARAKAERADLSA